MIFKNFTTSTDHAQAKGQNQNFIHFGNFLLTFRKTRSTLTI